MAIVKNFIEEHNGEIKVKSEINKETTMLITFPITDQKPINIEEKSSNKNTCIKGNKSREIKNILIIEDNPIILKVWHEYFSGNKLKLFLDQDE